MRRRQRWFCKIIYLSLTLTGTFLKTTNISMVHVRTSGREVQEHWYVNLFGDGTSRDWCVMKHTCTHHFREVAVALHGTSLLHRLLRSCGSRACRDRSFSRLSQTYVCKEKRKQKIPRYGCGRWKVVVSHEQTAALAPPSELRDIWRISMCCNMNYFRVFLMRWKVSTLVWHVELFVYTWAIKWLIN